MNEITRREMLKRTGGIMPLAVLSRIALSPLDEAEAQSPPPPLSPENRARFAKLSALLTGYGEADLDPVLLETYAARLEAAKPIGGLFVDLLEQYGRQGDEWVAARMNDPQCHYYEPPPPPKPPPPTPPGCVQPPIIAGAQALISNWEKNSKSSGLVLNTQLVCAPDYASASTDCKYAFLIQDIVAIWYISGIYRQAYGVEFNMADQPPVPLTVPSQAFHYGSSRGHVSALVFPTVNGETHPLSAPNVRGGSHPFAQCGGEFGYWNKKPKTI